MKLWKKEKSCCEGNCTFRTLEKESDIKILGSGCAKCQALESATKEAVLQLGLDLSIEHITDFSQIASYGVMSTPALVYQGKVVSYGKVLSVEEIKKILQSERDKK